MLGTVQKTPQDTTVSLVKPLAAHSKLCRVIKSNHWSFAPFFARRWPVIDFSDVDFPRGRFPRLRIVRENVQIDAVTFILIYFYLEYVFSFAFFIILFYFIRRINHSSTVLNFRREKTIGENFKFICTCCTISSAIKIKQLLHNKIRTWWGEIVLNK